MQIEKDNLVQEKKKVNAGTIIGILIAITIVAVIAIIMVIISLMGKKLTVEIDGKTVSVSEDTFITTDDGKIYVSIKDIAPLVGYEAHNGEYKVDIEDTSKMYIETIQSTDTSSSTNLVKGTETTSFYLNSTTISKVEPDTTDDYENITIEEPVISVNDKMYIINTGFSIAFNSLFYYNQSENKITIQTLPYLVEAYSTNITEYGYAKLSEDFNNQKALIYGLIIGSKEGTEKFGVVDTQGNEILSPRYNKIEFIESTGEFIITNSSEKAGIAYNTGKTKITVAYDEIKVMDSNLGLYLVKSNNKYGVIDSSENTIIYIEYDKIGIDTSSFPNDNIKNQYILYNTIIPAQINGKWRLFDTSGNKITNDEFDTVGYINGTSSNQINENALTIGETNTIVVGNIDLNDTQKNKKIYGGIDVKGNYLIPIMFEKIYSTTSAGNTTYYIYHNETDYDATEYINVMKERLGYEEETAEENKVVPNQENENTINNETTDNQNIDVEAINEAVDVTPTM